MNSEPLLSIRTVHGWLSLLAAMTLLSRPGREPDQLISTCPLPVGMLDLPGRTLLAASGRLAELLALADPGDCPLDMAEITDRPDDMGRLFDLVQAGALDMFAATRSLRRRAGETVATENWVVVSDAGQRHRALWVVVPAGEGPASWVSERPDHTWPREVSGLVVGSFDPALQIGRISVDVHGVLGLSSEQLVGRALTELVHPHDLPELFASMGTSLADGTGVGAQLRLANCDGEWVPTRWIVTPVVDESLRFGFAFATSRSDGNGTDLDDNTRRMAALERHLWRIAQEVQASGVAAGLNPVPEPGQLPGLGDLSPRQWEVLTRLLRGERVPTIARDLYISQSTVRNHLADMFRKLGVHSQQQLLDLLRTDPHRQVGP